MANPTQQANYGTVPSTGPSTTSPPQDDDFFIPRNPRTRPMPASRFQRIKTFSKQNYGILILVLAQFFASLMALIARYLSISLPPGQNFNSLHICFVRMSITALMSYVWMWKAGVPHAPFGPKGVRGLLCFRALAGFTGLVSLYYSLKYLPLPDSTVIVFLTPLLVSLLCSVVPSLSEPFTAPEAIGGILSLFGVVLIARPTFLFGTPSHTDPGNVTPQQRAIAVVVSVVGVFGAASAYTLIRWIGKRAHPLISVTYFSSFTAVLSAVGLLAIPSAGGFKLPQGRLQWELMIGIGLCGFLFQYLLTKGMQVTKGGRAASIIYTQEIYALLFEWLVWGNLPTVLSACGGALILSGVVGAEIWKKQGNEEDVKKDNVQAIFVEEGGEASQGEGREPLLPTTRQD
ncbi:hypothetical protein BJ508DRAFT_418792 [Ascobolus immersus RN42]|uniref:EamA domain-containing protein n=1 Tax=Ascobolus immersus RN42 TaxID=1160509 RepID=A0A3N4HQG9_ASCIM|nr:hypothetical protein BJ508DRAFT_418792 [Ascobolus immersus RN42]